MSQAGTNDKLQNQAILFFRKLRSKIQMISLHKFMFFYRHYFTSKVIYLGLIEI